MPASKWRVSAGPRTIVARSCLDCGLLLLASAFNRNSKGYTDTTCSACRARAARSHGDYSASADVSRMRRFTRSQLATRPAARRNGLQWTMPELEVVERDDLTAEECALMLGRTYAAVMNKRHTLRREPQWGARVGSGQ